MLQTPLVNLKGGAVGPRRSCFRTGPMTRVGYGTCRESSASTATKTASPPIPRRKRFSPAFPGPVFQTNIPTPASNFIAAGGRAAWRADAGRGVWRGRPGRGPGGLHRAPRHRLPPDHHQLPRPAQRRDPTRRLATLRLSGGGSSFAVAFHRRAAVFLFKGYLVRRPGVLGSRGCCS